MKNLNCRNNSNNIIIYNILRRLGLRPNHRGTVFIVKAVQLAKKKSDVLIIQDIYFELSEMFDNFTIDQIRVSIKYAINNRNEEKSIQNFSDIFGYDYDNEIFTNKDFIEELSRII